MIGVTVIEPVYLTTRPPDGAFITFPHWVNFATRCIGGANALCVDAADRVCRCGADFMRARDEGTFPVRYYHGAGGQSPAEQRRQGRLADRMLHPWRTAKMRRALEQP